MTTINKNPEIETFTFWELLKVYTISIPKLQRDYAQGRKELKTESIRENFVGDIFATLSNAKPNLNLDFVYGSTKGAILTPLDGQQRLTTLFLLHWYIAYISENLKVDEKERLSKFSYETRLSSRRFCYALINDVVSDGDNIRKNIENSSWYQKTWFTDPTVRGMLRMLDSIQKNFNNKDDAKVYWDELTRGKHIQFQFLPMSMFKLTDELYTKMNARGKAVSDFENLKASLDERLTNKADLYYINKWAGKLDGIWTDLFWRNDDGDCSIDSEMFNFFKSMALFQYATKNSNLGKKEDFEKRVTELNTKDSYISVKQLNEILFPVIDASANNHFVDIELFLDTYSEKEEQINEILKEVGFWNSGSNLFKLIIGTPTFKERAFFYGLYRHIINHPIIVDQEFKRFIRVVRNLVENCDVNASTLSKVLNSIDLLSVDNDVFYCLQKGLEFGGSKYQIDEEIVKARLILENQFENWEEALNDAEDHPFFKGQISFLIEMSGNSLMNFLEYSAKAKLLFPKGDLLKMRNVQMALLAKGDYLFSITANRFGFCNNSDQWKRELFRSKDKGKLGFFKELFDDVSSKHLADDLIRISNVELTESDWRTFFLNYPSVLDDCSEGLIHYKNENVIYLLSKEQMSSKHSELRSRCFYFEYLKSPKMSDELFSKVYAPFTNRWYYKTTSADQPCAVIDKFIYEEKNYVIVIYFRVDGKYHIQLYIRSKNELVELIPDHVIAKSGMTKVLKDNSRLEVVCNSMEEANFKVLEICNRLNELVNI